MKFVKGGKINLTKNKNLKKLILGLILLFICIFLFSLVTFALFSNKNDGNNNINVSSSKLKVDIVNEDDVTLVGDVLKFVDDSDNDYLFEPGKSFHTQGFKVKNTGEILINYIITISCDEKIDLKQYFDFWIVTDIENLDSAVNLQSYKGILEKQQTSEVFYLIARMKETSGNEAKNKIFKGVGITVNAVQSNVNF